LPMGAVSNVSTLSGWSADAAASKDAAAASALVRVPPGPTPASLAEYWVMENDGPPIKWGDFRRPVDVLSVHAASSTATGRQTIRRLMMSSSGSAPMIGIFEDFW